MPPPVAPPAAAGNAALPWIIVAVLAVAIALAAVYFATRDGGEAVGEQASSDAGGPMAPVETVVGPVVTKFVASTANIRNVPTAQGPDSRVLSTLRPGTQVTGQMVTGPGNAYWLKLSDGRGYVSAINLSDGPTVAAPAVQAPMRAPMVNGVYCSVAIRSGNLRIRANPAGRIVGGLPRGAQFQMYGEPVFAAGYYWVQVQPSDPRFSAGWVASDHIRC